MRQFTRITLATLALIIGLVAFGAFTVSQGIVAIMFVQLLAFALAKPQGVCLNAVLTPDQVVEFQSILRDVKGGWSKVKDLPSTFKTLEEALGHVKIEVDNLRKISLGRGGLSGRGLRKGQVVTDECAEYLAAIVICGAEKYGKLASLDSLAKDNISDRAKAILGSVSKSALTSSDIPLPTEYGNEVVQLVWQYGQARQYGTVYPMGAGQVKLPRLKTSPAFGLIAQSATVTEKSPQVEYVTFDAKKWGGLVRIPSEIEADSFASFGQWLAEYCAREMAKIEDTVFWVADGTSTYASIKGLAKAVLDLSKNVTLASTKTKPSDITLADLRSLRAKIATAAHGEAAYYMNRSMEALLVSFNTSSTVVPYVINGADGQARLDGYPIKWVDVLPPYDTSAHASQLQVLFGAAHYHYLGARPGMGIATSDGPFFDTDELAVRALGRFTTGLMADDAMAVLQLAAS